MGSGWSLLCVPRSHCCPGSIIPVPKADNQVVFPALLPLTYIPNLLARTKALFLSLFEPYLRSLVESLKGTFTASATALQELRDRIESERWERIFERCLRDCEGKDQSKKSTGGSLQRQAQLAAAASGHSSTSILTLLIGNSDYVAPGGGASDSPVSAEEIAKNVQALKGRMRGKGRGTPSPSNSPSKKGPSSNSAASKLMRKWGDSSVTAEDMASLDYSTPPPDNTDGSGPGTPIPVDTDSLVSADAMGVRTANGYEVADWDYRREELPTEDEILAKGAKRLNISSTAGGASEEEGVEGGTRWTNMFSRLAGKKTISAEDLKPVLADMERNLMDKNVAKDISEKLCESVGAALVGKKLGGLTSESTMKVDQGVVLNFRRQDRSPKRPLFIPYPCPHP
jgi:signal recognition particle receptor subunit alpha